MTEPVPPPPSFLLNAAISIGAVVILFLCLELGVRLLEWRGPVKARWNDRPPFYFITEGSPTTRDRSYSPEKPPRAFRIAVVGDSFTFGPHLQPDDTFPKRLERWLNLNRDARPVEVLNFGYSGFSTKDETALVDKAIDVGSDLIVLQITLNDAEPHALTPEEKEREYGHTFLTGGIYRYSHLARFVAERLHNRATRQRFIEYHRRYFENPPESDVFGASLEKIRRAAAQRSIPVVGMIFPLCDFPFDGSYPFAATHRTIGRALDRAGIPHFDLLPGFHGIPHERLQVIPGIDNHPNEIAHRIAAERLLAYLRKHHLLPEGIYPAQRYKQRQNLKEKRYRVPVQAAG